MKKRISLLEQLKKKMLHFHRVNEYLQMLVLGGNVICSRIKIKYLDRKLFVYDIPKLALSRIQHKPIQWQLFLTLEMI